MGVKAGQTPREAGRDRVIVTGSLAFGEFPPLIAPLQLAHFLGKGNLLPGLVILLSALGRWRGIGIGSFPFPGSSMLSLVGGLVREGVQV